MPFLSEPEAVPITKAIGHQLSRMLPYETACGSKAVSLNAAEPPRQPLQRREVLTVPPLGAVWQVVALPASLSLVHN